MPDSSVIVVAHQPLASALASVAKHILGEIGMLSVVDIEPDCDSDAMVKLLLERLPEIDRGAGVLLLSDLKGGTPGNIASRAHERYRESSLVFGVNLPMLLRAINYIEKPHAELAMAASEGACSCVTIAD